MRTNEANTQSPYQSSQPASTPPRAVRFSQRSSGFSLSPIKQIEIAASRIPGVVSLAQGIPALPTPQVIKDFVHDRISAGACDQYSLSPGLLELREILAASLAEDGAQYDPESEIIVTAGAIEGMTATLLGLINPGDEVLIPSPTYTSFIGSIRLAGGIPKHVALDEDRGFDLSVDRFAEAITNRTRAIILCTPNNPTGTIYSHDETEAVLRLAAEHNITVIVDEVYKDFYYSREAHQTPAAFPWARDYIVRVCSFSKAFSMTGWRVGFIA
ncbi:MAG: pyridoxal phosphate-dependent aminotransferase, partial [Bdellovibrionales bacterium]|nr:pyridoxal phosphate-dependent aminotransferase [Bdellovibrionales bacterium]